MGAAGRTEGYLYSFGVEKSGGIYCVLTFCILSGQHFAQLRHKTDLVTLRSGVLDSSLRVEDTGRQLVCGKVLYTIRLYHAFDHSKEVLLGSSSAEEASEWIRALVSAISKSPPSILDSWPSTGNPSIQAIMNKQHTSKRFTNEKVVPLLESTVPAPPPKWRLLRCENGLRFFEEMCSGSKVPVMKAVGVVKGQADMIFDEIMNYGPERFHWDHTVETASIVEVIDGHSDIIHVCLKQDWWRWLQPRDFCISRYWKREENGAYTVFYRSVAKQPPEPGHVRATIHSGGYMITPLNASKCLVESVFEIDVGGWPAWVGSSYCTHLRNNLLSVIAGIREYFAANRMDSIVSDMKQVMTKAGECSAAIEAASVTAPFRIASTPFLDTDMEHFFDARADQLSDTESHGDAADVRHRNVKAAHNHGNDKILEKRFSFSGTLSKGSGRNSVSEPDASLFKLRGKRFFNGGLLVPAEQPCFRLVASDWYKSNEKLDNVSSRRSIVQNQSTTDLFFFTFNLQVPHSGSYYSLIFYFATRMKILEGSLLHQFIHKDDEFRNQRLLLLPSVPEGSWIVRQAVGSRAVVLGQILECTYHQSSNYIEVDVNMGSSGIVRGVMGIVFGYISALVVDMGFSLRAEQENELPEELIAAVRCSKLELNTAVDPVFP